MLLEIKRVLLYATVIKIVIAKVATTAVIKDEVEAAVIVELLKLRDCNFKGSKQMAIAIIVPKNWR